MNIGLFVLPPVIDDKDNIVWYIYNELGIYASDAAAGQTVGDVIEKNDRNPSGFQEAKRVDKEGASHGGVKTPHVHEKGKVRPARPDEIPTDLSKNK